MRILFITDNFPPEVNAPASRTFEHCREWVKNGAEVTVITCNPNFPQGKLYAGYTNDLISLEHIEGIKVVRVWSYITTNSGFVKRILDYMSFMVSATLASLRLGSYDLVVGTSPQFFTAVAAHLISKVKNIPFVFELRDIWPESIRAVGAMKSSKVLDWFETLELFLYRKATRIISVTHSFKQNLIARDIPDNKISVIRNGVDLERFYPRSKDEKILKELGVAENDFVFGYIGTHGMAHDLLTILKAAEALEEDYKSVKIVFIGSGAAKADLLTYTRENELRNVIFLAPVSKDEIPCYWSIMDASIIHLKNTPLFKMVIPSKIFESMAMNIPILLGVEGESSELVRDKTGVCFEPGNERELTHLIKQILVGEVDLNEFREKSHVYAKTFDRKNLAHEMLTTLRSIAFHQLI